MEPTRKVTQDIHILPSYVPFPGFGLVPVNAFLLKAQEPVLIDTGLNQDSEAFMAELRQLIDPADLRWLWLTHPDQDHVGSLKTLMTEVPQLKLITTYLGYGGLSLFMEVGLDRIYLLNPGESLEVGDRTLTAIRPPTFDNPASTGFFDSKSKAFFSSDCFGALLAAPSDDAESINREELRQGQILWTSIDSPWLHKIDRQRFATDLKEIEALEADVVLSSHLPPATTLTDSFLSSLAAVPESSPFVGPNQAALTAMMTQMTQTA